MRNRRSVFRLIVAAIATNLASPWAVAQERGTPDEAKAMVTRALDHIKKVGADAAYKDFTEDKANWNKKDVYLFVLTMKGDQLAHGMNPKQIGKNFWEVKDANGKLLFQEFAATANKGGGWVDYEWSHPQTKKMESKTSYIVKIPNTDHYMGAGAYK